MNNELDTYPDGSPVFVKRKIRIAWKIETVSGNGDFFESSDRLREALECNIKIRNKNHGANTHWLEELFDGGKIKTLR